MSTQFDIDSDISHLTQFNLQEARAGSVDRRTVQDKQELAEKEEARELALDEDKKRMLQSIEELTALNQVEKEDFTNARRNIKEIAEKSNELLTEFLKIATYSDNHLVIQAAATLIRTVAETNMDVLNIHEKKLGIAKRKKDIIAEVFKTVNGGSESSPTNQQINSPVQVNGDAVFVGTTADLNKFFKGRGKKNDEDVIDVRVLEPQAEPENDSVG